jgi:hypothetical protein
MYCLIGLCLLFFAVKYTTTPSKQNKHKLPADATDYYVRTTNSSLCARCGCADAMNNVQEVIKCTKRIVNQIKLMDHVMGFCLKRSQAIIFAVEEQTDCTILLPLFHQS